MLELRKDPQKIFRRLAQGESLVLTHRGRPVARLEPPPDVREIPDDDPLLQPETYSFAGPGGRLSNRKIDRLIYGA